ncbi:TadE/TadG family type IV pilus assembly protein [Brevundimonas sp.]|uniref:TadE/TadG family type IV pilus assembly protein n=1 Tax=Brevundimonas sp. TaxID=1871086 RepID=UPI0025B804C7|nr:TadE/TadG family type IV pilus assembly protein [Brevundimonas sp.]
MQRFARARHGGVAMMFALALPVLAMTALVGVDVHRISTVRANLQDALDAAALAAARSSHMDDAGITIVGMASLRANLQAYPQISLREDLTTFRLTADGAVIAVSKVDVDTLVANIFLPPYGQVLDDQVQVGVESEVLRSSTNLEVALVLDITGSMAGSRIATLRDSATELVELVVQTQQTPYYSKAAIIPYSMGVNLGSMANAARSTPPSGRNITDAVWSTGSIRTISSISKNNSRITVTSSGHGFQTGDFVYVWNASGMTQINDQAFRVRRVDTNTFRLQTASGQDINPWNYGDYWGNGRVVKCLRNDCAVTITSNNHGFQNGGQVRIFNVNGLSTLNSTTYVVADRTTHTFVLSGSNPRGQSYSSGGAAWCADYGCQYFTYTGRWGAERTSEISTCVSERTGADAYTDRSPAEARVGANYPIPGNNCPSNALVPLTSDRNHLTQQISLLRDGGSTAGQVGLAWGWYAVSPNFNGLWPSAANHAAPYGADDLLKVVVMMTDGEFNTPYCNGVIAQNAGAGSGDTNWHIRCDAQNGSPFQQAVDLCNAMKARNIIIYTVGLDVTSVNDNTPNVVDTAREVIETCATSPDHVYLPSGDTDLREAFRAIARSISDLRIAR